MKRSRREVLKVVGVGFGAIAATQLSSQSAKGDESRGKSDPSERAFAAPTITIDNISDNDEIARSFTVYGTFAGRKVRDKNAENEKKAMETTTITCVLRDVAGQITSGAVTMSTNTWVADFEDVPDPPPDGTDRLIITATLTTGGSTPQIVSSEVTNLTLNDDDGGGGPIVVLTQPSPPGGKRKASPIDDKPKFEIKKLKKISTVKSGYVETGRGFGGKPIGKETDAKYDSSKYWNADHGTFGSSDKRKRASYLVTITYQTDDGKSHTLRYSRPRLQGD